MTLNSESFFCGGVLSLDRYSKEAGDERDLPHDVSFFNTMHLSFPSPVHHLEPL